MGDGSDEVMAAITEAVGLGQDGQRTTARDRLAAIWAELGPSGDSLHRCVLAHHLADLQDDPADELAWDLRALEAADTLTDERVQRQHATLAVRGFLPSLHLNLAEDYRRLDRYDLARAHLALARRAAPALAEDGYGDMIRAGIDRLGARLDGDAPVNSDDGEAFAAR